MRFLYYVCFFLVYLKLNVSNHSGQRLLDGIMWCVLCAKVLEL